MLLSIVIPTKDRPEYLQKILGSISLQIKNSNNVEVLIIDDGSFKRNILLIKNICTNQQFRLIELKKSQGSGAARNKGITESKGEWIAFLDDDVVPEDNWLLTVLDTIKKISPNIVGIEGQTKCYGSGLWDREVENIHGNLFITANIIYKKETLILAGLFDERFLKYGEDQELALRVKRYGEIIFNPSIKVSHQPRNISFKTIILNSFERISNMLNSEYLLYKKHPSDYCTIRYANSFRVTLKNTILGHVVISLKRRKIKDIVTKPIQASYLIISLIFEQISALLFAPKLIINDLTNSNTITNSIDIKRTAAVNKISLSICIKLLTKPFNIIDTFNRVISGKRTYKNINSKMIKHSRFNPPNILLRVDDIFLHKKDQIIQFCNIISQQKITFLAAITLNELVNPEYKNLIQKVKDSGGIIAIHGISHEGKFGPFPSEILQLNYKQLDDIIDQNKNIEAQAFIAPFNAIRFDQIIYLSKWFPVICGGPETGRFTCQLSIPTILKNNSSYIPSLPPYYNSSKEILKNKIDLNSNGVKPLTFHLNIEYSDNFNSMTILINKYKDNFLNWKSFISEFVNA